MSHLEKARQIFVELQSKVMGEISSMLRTAKLTSILELADEHPTFTESAAILEHFSKITHTLAPMLGFEDKAKALDPYISAVKRLGQAIDDGCTDSLGEVIAELDELPYI